MEADSSQNGVFVWIWILLQMMKQEKELESQLGRCEASVEELKRTLRESRKRNDSLHADLASVRELIVQLDAEKVQRSQELREKDTELKNV